MLLNNKNTNKIIKINYWLVPNEPNRAHNIDTIGTVAEIGEKWLTRERWWRREREREKKKRKRSDNNNEFWKKKKEKKRCKKKRAESGRSQSWNMATAIHHQRRLVTGNPSRSALQRCVSTWNQRRFSFKSMNFFFPPSTSSSSSSSSSSSASTWFFLSFYFYRTSFTGVTYGHNSINYDLNSTASVGMLQVRPPIVNV